jgi:hypothetical protein
MVRQPLEGPTAVGARILQSYGMMTQLDGTETRDRNKCGRVTYTRGRNQDADGSADSSPSEAPDLSAERSHVQSGRKRVTDDGIRSPQCVGGKYPGLQRETTEQVYVSNWSEGPLQTLGLTFIRSIQLHKVREIVLKVILPLANLCWASRS